MTAAMAIGFGLLAVGLVFALTGRRTTEEITTRQTISAVVRALAYVAVAIGVAVLLASLDPPFARIVVGGIAMVGIGWSVVRAARSPSPTRKLILLGATLALSVVLAAVLGMLTGGDESEIAVAASGVSIEDVAGDCQCDGASDLQTLALSPGGVVLATVGASIPEGAVYWLWSADDPLTPTEIIRKGDAWTVASSSLAGSDPAGIVVVDSAVAGIGLQFGYDLGAVAVTSAGGDRIPDTGYFGVDGTVASTEIEDRYQSVYGDLGAAHRSLAAAFINSRQHTGAFSYDVGISVDPEVRHTGTLIVTTDSVEFRVSASDTRGDHTDRLAADGSAECVDADMDPCIGMWVNPFLALDHLLSSPGSSEILVLESREIAGEEAACVAVTDPGTSALHEGEFCTFRDGTIAFADDRTAGIVLVLVEP